VDFCLILKKKLEFTTLASVMEWGSARGKGERVSLVSIVVSSESGVSYVVSPESGVSNVMSSESRVSVVSIFIQKIRRCVYDGRAKELTRIFKCKIKKCIFSTFLLGTLKPL
jgi:hypothetical protein